MGVFLCDNAKPRILTFSVPRFVSKINPQDSQRDRVFARPLAEVRAFRFDDEVARVFDDMIGRSVPGYDLLLRLIALYGDVFIQPGSRVYDLGCSTGLASRILAQQARGRAELIAVDNSEAMLNECRSRHADLPIDWRCADIEDLSIEDASLVVLNLTLQFIAPERRSRLIERIYQGLRPGGALVLTEKIRYRNEALQRRMTELYQAFKKTQGYSDLEISQKRSALERVLVPDCEETHLERLRAAGFGVVDECFRGLLFVSWLAVKP